MRKKKNAVFYYFVYLTTNWYNGKIYIGAHKTSNLNDDYLGSGTALKAAIKKYGKGYFTREFLSFHDSFEDALDAEEILVNMEFVSRKDTYNLQKGGKGGFKPGKCFSEEHRRNLSIALTGRIIPEVAKKNMREAAKNRPPVSEELKKKRSDNAKNMSEEHRQKLSIASSGTNNPMYSRKRRLRFLIEIWERYEILYI